MLKKEYEKHVLEVKKVLDRVMIDKLEIEAMMMDVVCGYVPLICC